MAGRGLGRVGVMIRGCVEGGTGVRWGVATMV